MTSPAGEQFGPYTVYEQIGMGGMATVHRAETTGLAGFRKAVALKRMLPSIASNEEFVRSFVREARLASHLRHSNVAQTYDLGKVEDVYFIAMELVNGRTLRDMLRNALETRSRIPIPISLHILNQVCDALDYAHNLCNESGTPLGIIHRDVSPSNVIVSDAGIVKLIDFGIAKASTSSLQLQTMSGVIKGKFSYIAPEYIAGQIDARADLFAVGIVAYELLTGSPLFKGKNDMDTLDRVQTMQIPPPSTLNADIPPAIDAIVMTALQRNPDVRWQRASAMRIALTTELSRLGITTSDRQLAEWVGSVAASRVPEAVSDVDSQPPTQLLRVGSESKSSPRDSNPSVIVEVVSGDSGTQPTSEPEPPQSAKPTEPQAVPILTLSSASDSVAADAPAAAPALVSAIPTVPERRIATPTDLTGPSAPTAELPAHPRTTAEPPMLPAAPLINRASELADQPSGRITQPRFGRTLQPSPALADRSPVQAHRTPRYSILLWILISAAATAGVVYFALPFLL